MHNTPRVDIHHSNSLFDRYDTGALFIDALSVADFVIDETSFWGKENNVANMQTEFGVTDASKFDNFWRHDRICKTAAPDCHSDDWFEHKFAEPDVVLEDMISIMFPTIQPDHVKMWFRHPSEAHFESSTVTCVDVNAPLVFKHNGCVSDVDCSKCPDSFETNGGCTAVKEDIASLDSLSVDPIQQATLDKVWKVTMLKDAACGTCAFDSISEAKKKCELAATLQPTAQFSAGLSVLPHTPILGLILAVLAI